MCVGTSTAIAIAATAASAAGSIAAAKIGSNAAHDAAATQSASADKAITVQQQVYQDQQKAQAPYQQLGQQALGRLSTMGPSQAQFSPSNYRQGAPIQQQQPQQMGTLASMGQMQPMGQGMAAGQATGGDMVNVQAPDGSVKPFPRMQAQQIIQAAGAKGQQLRIVP